MNAKLKIGLAVGAIVALTGGVAWAQDPGTKSAGGTRAVGVPSYYIPIVPCRIVDTRAPSVVGGNLAPNEQRSFQAYDQDGYANQGGVTGDCGIDTNSTAIEATVTAVGPSADGYFRAWPSDAIPPNATFLNYTKGQNISNTGTISVGSNSQDLTVKNFGGFTHYVIDVQGYFVNFTA